MRQIDTLAAHDIPGLPLGMSATQARDLAAAVVWQWFATHRDDVLLSVLGGVITVRVGRIKGALVKAFGPPPPDAPPPDAEATVDGIQRFTYAHNDTEARPPEAA